MAKDEALPERGIKRAQKEMNILPLPWRRFAKIAWYPLAAIALVFIAISIPAYIGATTEELYGLPVALSPVFLNAFNIGSTIAFTAAALVSVALSAVLFLKRPDDKMALFISYFLLVYAVVEAGPLASLDSSWPGVETFSWSVIQPIFVVPLLITFLSIFPNGRFVPPGARWLVVTAWLYGPVSVLLLTVFFGNRFFYLLGILFWFGLLLTSLSAQIYRYISVSNVIERQQAKWVVYGFALALLIVFVLSLLTLWFHTLPQGTPLPWWAPIVRLSWPLAIAALPISLAIAVMRYHLFEIDILIARSLVYGGLTAAVVGVYILIVGTLGTLFQVQGNLLLALLATGLVAVLFQPLRERLQHSVNRLIYGERDDPFEALSRLGARLEAAITPAEVLPMLVETIAQTLKLPYVAILLPEEGGDRVAAAHGEASSEGVTFPLTHQGRRIGELVVAPRDPKDSFATSELRLLHSVARQAGAAVHTVQLTEDLQRSRRRLVTAREEERRRLRRDLHDGLGPTLAALHVQSNALRRLIRRDPDSAEALVSEFNLEIREAINDIRRVVYELRPPTLDELGLVGATRAYAAQCSRQASVGHTWDGDPIGDGALYVRVESRETMPALPAAVEVAAYYIIREALTNVLHHAEASRCLVLFQASDMLVVEISDNGIGLQESHPAGIGLVSMRERAEELGGTFIIEPISGGGTRVLAQFPLKEVLW
ncbi:MAG: GAF domain-containing sensor histidine kinase [Anaerolineales bacterium]